MYEERVVSGMRPTGALHLGHFHGALKNWVKLQSEYPCLYFVADWHALTTHYETPEVIEESVWDMVIDWLAAGIDPAQATLFIQSRIPEHAELHTLLSMITPLSWLERVPSYKDQQEKLIDRDLSTYGFLGYPLLQAADVLIYRAKYVPVGEDQVPHVEMMREVARRFNHVYGREPGFEDKAKAAARKLGGRKAKVLMELRTRYQERGDAEALATARALLEQQGNLSVADRERLFGYLEGGGRLILVEPEALLTESSKLPGTDGQKMSKSYNNTISLREDAESVKRKIRTMPTDPARVKRSDPGDPNKCPVWQLHLVYSNEQTREWANQGCRTAGIGCLECKQPVIDAVLAEQGPMRERAQKYLDDPTLVRKLVAKVRGEPFTELPRDLYIPPDALEVFFETFEGPLDLLLYLIRRANLDILDIPMAGLTEQYMEYVEVMRAKNLELAAEYLVMAAMLMEIKSRMLLPRPTMPGAEDEDPRAVLVRAKMMQHHRVTREELSVREHMSVILRRLRSGGFAEFGELFDPGRGVPVLVVNFLAVLELVRENLIEVTQSESFAPLYVKLAHAHSE